MSVTRHAEPHAFLAAARPLTDGNPAVRTLVAAIVARWHEGDAAAARYAATFDDGAEHGFAFVASGQPLVLENSAPRAAEAFAADLPAAWRALPGVLGEHAPCVVFAQAWCERFGGRWHEAAHLRHHSLTCVDPVPFTPGGMRKATGANADWLLRLSLDFAFEARLPDARASIVEGVARRLRDGGYRIWEDDGAVAFAGFGTAEATSARIAPVYTLPGRRRRGYAALTAALSQALLDAGKRELFLLTDVANPTSNAIYAKVGYRPLGDTHRIDFELAHG
jgi:hypothetical protein